MCSFAVVWSALCRKQSVVAIASGKGGKTMSYLIPALNHVLTAADCQQQKGERRSMLESPLVIVVCPTWRKAMNVDRLIGQILSKPGVLNNYYFIYIFGDLCYLPSRIANLFLGRWDSCFVACGV
jgi:superfamily II DNA/RNA helicase